MTSATKSMTLDEFLALPGTEPASEFIGGEVIQKPMPSALHSRIAAELAALLRNLLAISKAGWIMVEPRQPDRDEQRSYLPDVGVVLNERLPRDRRLPRRGALEYVPDLAIEILSPDDRARSVAEKTRVPHATRYRSFGWWTRMTERLMHTARACLRRDTRWGHHHGGARPPGFQVGRGRVIRRVG
jgi:Uma2 family endonuclease